MVNTQWAFSAKMTSCQAYQYKISLTVGTASTRSQAFNECFEIKSVRKIISDGVEALPSLKLVFRLFKSCARQAMHKTKKSEN